MTVAFHAWNPFQIFQIANIARAYGDSVLLLERRASMDFGRVFHPSILKSLGVPVLETTAKNIASQDGEFAAVVCQTPFRYMEQLTKTKRAAMQYSITKERHQHGAWRAMCDLNLVYGEYSRSRIAPFAPCRIVGNPRFDPWFEGQLDQSKLKAMRSKLDPTRKTILYLPTWGDLSSLPLYRKAVADLSQSYNVIAKVHHNTDALELDRKTALGEAGLSSIFGASDDSLYLLACCDMVLSDYSGAMFDAINVGKPVVLLQHEPEKLGGAKFGLESIEYARRDEIGPVATTPEALEAVLSSAFANPDAFKASNAALKAECFGLEQGSAAAAAQALSDLVNNRLEPRPFYQIYLRDEVIKGTKAGETLRANTKKLKPPRKSKRVLRMKIAAPTGVVKTRNLSIPRRLFRAMVKLTPGAAKGQFPKPFEALYQRLPAYILTSGSKDIAAAGYPEISLKLARMASLRGAGSGIAQLITLAGKDDSPELLADALHDFRKQDKNSRAMHARQAIRAVEAIGGGSVREFLQEAKDVHTEQALNPASDEDKRYGALKSLVKNRLISDAESLSKQVSLKPADKKEFGKAISQFKKRTKNWFPIIEVASRNLLGDEIWCMKARKIVPLSSIGDTKVVEFLVPPYFCDSNAKSDPAAHARICAFLRKVLDGLNARNIAIIPKHQFWLHIGHPTGKWPTISYHTTGSQPGRLHLKDAAIPGFFRFDEEGYAGFSSLAGLTELPEVAQIAPEVDIEESWKMVQERVVQARTSKYKQSETASDLPADPFIFFPLQMLDDTVVKLSWIPMLEAIATTIKSAERLGKTVVLKRHPMCKREDVRAALKTFAKSRSVVVTEGNIHDILPKAECVVTVNSGVGFEALLYGKRVITVGAAEYGLVTERCRQPSELQSALAAHGGNRSELIKRFVWYYLDRSVETRDVSKIVDWAENANAIPAR